MLLSLTVYDGPNTGVSWIMEEDQNEATIGRGSKCSIRLLGDRKVSRVHCKILNTPEGFLISDAGSMNGTFVNKNKITEKQLHLRHGDVIRVGDNSIRVEIQKEFFAEKPDININTDKHTSETTKPVDTVASDIEPRFVEGEIVFDKYKILEQIGGGMMSGVYKAEDIKLKRTVAIKILSKNAGENPEIIARFEREAQIYASLCHPNIISIYDTGRYRNFIYQILEYIDGINLEEYITQNGPLAHKLSLQITLLLASALKHALEKGVIHRDIKPANILINLKLQILKLVDMGLAKLMEDSGVTKAGTMLGTPYYMAPEQIDHPASVTHMADIYSLGGTLYTMLSGIPPYGDKPVTRLSEFIQYKLNHEPQPIYEIIPNISPEIVGFVERTMNRDPYKRFQTYSEIINSIQQILSSSP